MSIRKVGGLWLWSIPALGMGGSLHASREPMSPRIAGAAFAACIGIWSLVLLG